MLPYNALQKLVVVVEMATKMKKAGGGAGSKAADRMRRFSTATGAKVEETADGGVKVGGALCMGGWQ